MTTERESLSAILYRYAEDFRLLYDKQQVPSNDFVCFDGSYQKLIEYAGFVEQLISKSRDIHLVTDEFGKIINANSSAGVIAANKSLCGSKLEVWISENSLHNYRNLLAKMNDPETCSSGEWLLRISPQNKREKYLIVSVRVFPMPQHDDARLYWVIHDESALYAHEESSALSSVLFENTSEGVIVTDAFGMVRMANSSFCRLTRFAREEIVGHYVNVFMCSEAEGYPDEISESLNSTGCWAGEIQSRNKQGEVILLWMSVSAAHDRLGDIQNYVVVFSDVYRLLQEEQKLMHLAHYDALTDLPNRLLLQERLEQSIAHARRANSGLSVVFIDLDGFKAINDTHGHQVGDMVLQEVASRLAVMTREVDTVARFGGDEFVILSPGLSGQNDLDGFCRKILDKLSAPIYLDGKSMFVGGSLGCASYPEHASDSATLIRHADQAMYEAKTVGGYTHRIFQPQLVVSNERSLGEELQLALSESQLHLLYQPQIRVNDGRLIGVEALLRWKHPSRGDLLPEQFIGLAEQSGLILPIGEWVLQSACSQLARWHAQGLVGICVSVNVSSRQLRDENFESAVLSALNSSGVIPEALVLEVKEAEMTGNSQLSLERLYRLRKFGVKIAIDNFGRGYSSLNHLKQIRIDRLKIDQSMLSDLQLKENVPDVSLGEAIVKIGQALGADLVAEGVETVRQLRSLREQGCDAIQGYLSGPPMSSRDLLKWLEQRSQAVDVVRV